MNYKKGIIAAAVFGYLAKGAFYLILGGLALQASFRAGVAHLSLHAVLLDIFTHPYGQIILTLLIIGMIGYAIWRLTESFLDLENKGDDMSGLIQRGAYLVSGASYAAIAYSSLKLIAGKTNSQVTVSVKHVIDFVYHQPLGGVLIGGAGGILIVVGLFQFYRAATTRFKNKLDLSETSPTVLPIILWLGRVGFTARGILYSLIGLSLIIAAVTLKPSTGGGFGVAFQTLDTGMFAPWALGLVALGLIVYGLYAILLSKYRKFFQ